MKPGQLTALERLYKRRYPQDAVYSLEQARELALLSRAFGRQLGLLIDRKGKPQLVIAGEPGSIFIPELAPLPVGSRRLRGLRLLHTHLGEGGLNQEDLMDMLFLRLDAVAALMVTANGEPSAWQGAWLDAAKLHPQSLQKNAAHLPYFVQKPLPWHECRLNWAELIENVEAGFAKTGAEVAADKDRAFLISVSTEPLAVQESHLQELQALAETAGLTVCGSMMQRISKPDPRLILGKGKLAQLEVEALAANADILVFDGELSPAQLHNLADTTERRVLDRTQVILDIFAQRAESRAGKLQVELAQLAYMQPRLSGQHKALDRLAGGIGGRGAGETKLETDRRKSRKRMAALRQALASLRKQRGVARSKRARANVPVAALAGYTNAGKSTLLNKLTASHTHAEDRLFATLDPAARRLRFPKEREIVLTDTVGFIRNLPRELLEAFRATLEELESADLLLHVADASSPELAQQIEAVEKTFFDLELDAMPRLLVLNKCDGLDAEERDTLAALYPGSVLVSAKSGEGLEQLLQKMEQIMFAQTLQGEKSSEDCSGNP